MQVCKDKIGNPEKRNSKSITQNENRTRARQPPMREKGVKVTFSKKKRKKYCRSI